MNIIQNIQSIIAVAAVVILNIAAIAKGVAVIVKRIQEVKDATAEEKQEAKATVIENLQQVIFGWVTDAEKDLGGGTGKLKSSKVAAMSYQYIPDDLKPLFTPQEIQDMIDTVLEDAKKYWEKNEKARDYIESGQADAVVVVCDATCLERNLILVLQVLELTGKVLVCVNLLDEAKRLGVEVDLPALSRRLGTPVVGTSAGRQEGLEELKRAIARLVEADAPAASRREPRERVTLAERYAAQVVREERADRLRRQRRLDRLLTSKSTGIPLMLLLFGLVVWLTVAGANGPSALLTALFARVGEGLAAWLAPAPAWLSGILLDGVYRVTAWVVAVMLPPMAIFFPLFTLLEDLGYLPRVAFVMDHAFQKCRACGKQCLTMWMADMSLRYTRQ